MLTTSPALKSGASGAALGDGVGGGVGDANGVGVGVTVGLAVGVGVGVSIGGNVQAPRTIATTSPNTPRLIPTFRSVARQPFSCGRSAASMSAISRAFVVP